MCHTILGITAQTLHRRGCQRQDRSRVSLGKDSSTNEERPILRPLTKKTIVQRPGPQPKAKLVRGRSALLTHLLPSGTMGTPSLSHSTSASSSSQSIEKTTWSSSTHSLAFNWFVNLCGNSEDKFHLPFKTFLYFT